MKPSWQQIHQQERREQFAEYMIATTPPESRKEESLFKKEAAKRAVRYGMENGLAENLYFRHAKETLRDVERRALRYMSRQFPRIMEVAEELGCVIACGQQIEPNKYKGVGYIRLGKPGAAILAHYRLSHAEGTVDSTNVVNTGINSLGLAAAPLLQVKRLGGKHTISIKA